MCTLLWRGRVIKAVNTVQISVIVEEAQFVDRAA